MQIKRVQTKKPKPSLLLVGSGPVILPFIERFGRDWSLTVVLRKGVEARVPDTVKTVRGNATDSVVLRAAGAESAKAVVAATDDDAINLEVCRISSRLFEVPKRIALVQNCSQLSEFQDEGIETIHTGTSIAMAAETHLQKGSKAASGIGLGQGEVYEVKVLPGSTAIGKTPRLLNPQSWLIAAIYRDKELIVPHGNTEICEGDSILLVGQPDILPGVANYFRAGTSDFPLQYGARVVGLCPDGADDGITDEVRYLAESTEATGFAVLQAADQESVELDRSLILTKPKAFSARALSEKLDSLDSGCTVLRAPKRRWYQRFGLGEDFFFRFMECHTEPVFISRGTYPYKRIALGVQPGRPAQFAAEMAVDLARGLNAELTAIIAVPSTLVTGVGYRGELEEALESVVRLGEVYGLGVKTEVVNGNPVLALEEQSKDFDLLVVAHRVGKRSSMLNPDVSRHLILRGHCSVLALPHNL
jgi:trk/ktr system potassium uptake protein